MISGGKYARLSEHLESLKGDEVEFTFAQFEHLLGSPLPESARIYPAWWANQTPPSVQSRAWISAGWRVHASLKSKKVTFRRDGARTAAAVVIRSPKTERSNRAPREYLQEDSAKEHLRRYLQANGWRTTVRSGKAHGIDIEAFRDGKRWIIEVKGSHERNPVNVTYFLSVIGELLQRMNDPAAKYSVAFPDTQQYRGLWERLPDLAKERTGISCMFVRANGEVSEEK